MTGNRIGWWVEATLSIAALLVVIFGGFRLLGIL